VREPRPISGAKTPLFDRLLDDGPDVRQPVSPNRAFDAQSLRESVRADLVRLLNTRTNLRGHIRRLAQGTVLDYGIPDLSPISAADEQQRADLAKRVEAVISTYEPRLKSVKVVIQLDKTDPRKLLGIVYANLMIGSVVEPVYFPLALDSSVKNIEIEGSGSTA
jgi:type VI secretion system lysozyme-like protein